MGYGYPPFRNGSGSFQAKVIFSQTPGDMALVALSLVTGALTVLPRG